MGYKLFRIEPRHGYMRGVAAQNKVEALTAYFREQPRCGDAEIVDVDLAEATANDREMVRQAEELKRPVFCVRASRAAMVSSPVPDPCSGSRP